MFLGFDYKQSIFNRVIFTSLNENLFTCQLFDDSFGWLGASDMLYISIVRLLYRGTKISKLRQKFLLVPDQYSWCCLDYLLMTVASPNIMNTKRSTHVRHYTLFRIHPVIYLGWSFYFEIFANLSSVIKKLEEKLTENSRALKNKLTDNYRKLTEKITKKFRTFTKNFRTLQEKNYREFSNVDKRIENNKIFIQGDWKKKLLEN